jgi:hypothetical protein
MSMMTTTGHGIILRGPIFPFPHKRGTCAPIAVMMSITTGYSSDIISRDHPNNDSINIRKILRLFFPAIAIILPLTVTTIITIVIPSIRFPPLSITDTFDVTFTFVSPNPSPSDRQPAVITMWTIRKHVQEIPLTDGQLPGISSPEITISATPVTAGEN